LRVAEDRLPEAIALLERALARTEKRPGGFEIEIAGAQFALAGAHLRRAPAAGPTREDAPAANADGEPRHPWQ